MDLRRLARDWDALNSIIARRQNRSNNVGNFAMMPGEFERAQNMAMMSPMGGILTNTTGADPRFMMQSMLPGDRAAEERAFSWQHWPMQQQPEVQDDPYQAKARIWSIMPKRKKQRKYQGRFSDRDKAGSY